MAVTSSDHIEVEWQFAAIDVRPVARWLEAAVVPGYAVVPGPTKDMEDTYFDTADWRLHRARFTCRMRKKGDGAELTVKSMAPASGGIRSRREVNEALPGPSLETARAASGPVGSIVRTLSGKRPIDPIFTIQTRRQTFALSDAEGLLAEIALDDVAIPLGHEDAPVRFSRVEVEVDETAVERVRRFVDVMVAARGLTPATTSKFETALLATGRAPAPSQPALGSTEVAAGMMAGEVAFAILRRHFAVFLANEASTRLGEDIEGLHDMRVAARRLRAAISAFRDSLGPRMERLRLELGWVAAALGEVRDLDVQLERMIEWRAGLATIDAHALDAVEALLRSRRETGRRKMLAVLDSRRYDTLVTRCTAALRYGPPRNLPAARQPILAVAPDLLERRYRRLRREGDAIAAGSPPEAYHALRIDAKKLRYAIEFVGPIYGKPAVEFSQRVTVLQDILGLHQDAEVACGMLREMAATRRLAPATILAMGAIAERYRVDAVRLRGEFPRAYKQLRGAEWRQLRRVVEARRPASG